MTRPRKRTAAPKGSTSRTPAASGAPFDVFARQTIELFTRVMIRAGCSPSAIAMAVRTTARSIPRTVRSAAKASRPDFNDAGHILTLWSKDPDYLSANGALRPIPARGPAPSIEALVARASPTLTFEEAWAQLERTRTLEHVGGLYVPVREAIIYLSDPNLLAANTLRFLNVCLQNLEHNMVRGSSEPWYLRSAQHADFPLDLAEEYLKASVERGMVFLRAEDDVMLRIADGVPQTQHRGRVSVNLFYSVLDADSADSRKSKTEAAPTTRARMRRRPQK